MTPRAAICHLDDSEGEPVRLALSNSVRIAVAPDAGSLLAQTARHAADVVFLVSGGASGADASLRLAESIRRQGNDIPIVLVAPAYTARWAVEAFRAGAADVIEPNASAEEVSRVCERIGLRCGAAAPAAGPSLVGQSEPMKAVVRQVIQAAAGDAPVLITGETGTGKEIAAEMIHARSRRNSGPLIAVNCAALPENLLESELFGHLKGAFTGAHRARPGAFAAASGGTVFLDEIGEMNATVQAKLLRVVENRAVRPLGADREVPVDVRLVAATNQDPERLVRERKFREDLYFRLNVARIHLPPLRARRLDIPLLIDHLMSRCADRQGVPETRLDRPLLERLLHYDWPGNVRELRNFLEALLTCRPSAIARFGDLPLHWRDRLRAVTNRGSQQRSRVLEALVSSQWNKSEAARKLACSRMTLYRRMARHNIARSAAG